MNIETITICYTTKSDNNIFNWNQYFTLIYYFYITAQILLQ